MGRGRTCADVLSEGDLALLHHFGDVEVPDVHALRVLLTVPRNEHIVALVGGGWCQ